jgi:hypothetical protein
MLIRGNDGAKLVYISEKTISPLVCEFFLLRMFVEIWDEYENGSLLIKHKMK